MEAFGAHGFHVRFGFADRLPEAFIGAAKVVCRITDCRLQR